MFPIYVKEPDGDPPQDPIYYLIAGNGIFLVKNHPLFHSKTQVRGISWLPSEEVSFKFLAPPLPKALLAQALAFFMGVWERFRTESIVVLYFKTSDQAYEIVVPDQLVGGIHCVYEEALPGLHSDDLRVGTIHSHGHADAFHSDRDNADESFQDGLHLIFGNLDTVPTLLCSSMIDGQRFSLPCEKLIEGMPAYEDLPSWAPWVEQQIGMHVRPLERPICFGA